MLWHHFQTYVGFKFGEAIPRYFVLFYYHCSEERLSKDSEYQNWTPLTLPLIPLHSPSNHSLEWCSNLSEWKNRIQPLVCKVDCLLFSYHILLIPACYPTGTVAVTHPASYSHCFAVQDQGLSSAVKCTVSTSGSVSLIIGCNQVCTLFFDLNSHFTDRT